MTNQNAGHGHVFPRPDGVKAKCGGPAVCAVCAVDLVKQKADAGHAATTPASEPLPCPFCGGSARIAYKGDHFVTCQGCKAFGPDADSDETAIKLWNRRSQGLPR
jgi:Lar family restriction alleviation protein